MYVCIYLHSRIWYIEWTLPFLLVSYIIYVGIYLHSRIWYIEWTLPFILFLLLYIIYVSIFVPEFPRMEDLPKLFFLLTNIAVLLSIWAQSEGNI
jgi:hypothetical protein